MKIEHLVIVPQDLRTAEPSFVDELHAGLFGVDGHVADIGDGSPFDVSHAPDTWLRAVHGFSWLRHLDLPDIPDAETIARAWVDDWLMTSAQPSHIRNAPEVIARRILSWLAHAGLILDAANRAHFDRVAQALADDIHRLDRTWRTAPAGAARLLAAIARVQARLSCDGSELLRQRAERDLARELDAQVIADGGHISRNPDILVEAMLDLLALRRCYQARQIPVPARIFAAMARIVPFLRFMRLGDGSLARFNGGGAMAADALALVVGYDAMNAAMPHAAAASGYTRIAAGDAVVIADTGPPLSVAHTKSAASGCLSFEMSVGTSRLFSNFDQHRETSRHSALSIEDASSGVLLAGAKGHEPLHMPGAVNTESKLLKALSWAAVHSGYAARFGLDHTRRMALKADGSALDGVDVLVPVARHALQPRAFAIHFHVDPSVTVRRGDRPGEVLLTLRDGVRWLFAADAKMLTIEASNRPGAAGLQIVLRGVHDGTPDPLAVHWSAKQLA